jgi:glycosyltransferase involved in cell wall biosynthesis
MTLKSKIASLVKVNRHLVGNKIVKQADRLRNIGDFAGAASLYSQHLQSHPRDFGIFVQYGNCLKDSGKAAESLEAYQAAIKLRPQDSDVYLQLARAFRKLGLNDEAKIQLDKALGIRRDFHDAHRELAAMGFTSVSQMADAVPRAEGIKTTLLDISDLILFLKDNTRVTGIQRVQACIVQEIILGASEEQKDNYDNIEFCYWNHQNERCYIVQNDKLDHLLNAISDNSVSRKKLDAALFRIEETNSVFNPRQGDVYVLLGAYWIGNSYTANLRAMSLNGVKIGVYVYDLIPITHPQYVTDSTRAAVLKMFKEVMSVVDFALTISNFVADELKYHLKHELNREFPVFAVPLGHMLPEIPQSLQDETLFKSTLPKEFVLCVCTLEGRKNHLLLLNIWKALFKIYGSSIPSLVLVGKKGWKIEDFMQQLLGSNYVDGKILILENLSDARVKVLYENCLFSIFPSFVEGWGLPVGESLNYGRPCIASNTSSIPEVGGDFCKYIDPHNFQSSLSVVEETLNDRVALAEWTERVKSHFKGRSWRVVGEDLVAKIQHASEMAKPYRLAKKTLTSGTLYPISNNKIKTFASSLADDPVAFVLESGWYDVEGWGCWAKRAVAKISLQTELDDGETVRFLLDVRLPPPSSEGRICISVGGSEAFHIISPDSNWIWQSGVVGIDGLLEIQIRRLDMCENVDINRPLFFGVSFIAFNGSNDLSGRIEILESLWSLRSTKLVGV